MAYTLELGGLSDNSAFNVTMGLSFIMLIGNMFGWVFVERYGRRSTALFGKRYSTPRRFTKLHLLGLT